jgi:hypothetical protein
MRIFPSQLRRRFKNIQDHNSLRTLHREAVLARNLSEFQTRLNAYQRV